MRRRRSKNFVKLSGNKDRNRTILWRARSYDGRHRWGALIGKTLRYNRQRQRWIRPPVSLSLSLPKNKREEERDYVTREKDTSI